MSGVTKSIKKVFKRVRKSKLLKTAIIGAAVWFTAGTASAYYAAPQAGLGSAMSASANSMYLTATTGSFVSGAEAAGMAAAEGASQAAMLTAQTAEFGGAGVAATEQALATTAATEAGVTTLPALVEAGGAPAAGMTSTELAATMVGGQAVSGAITAREEEKARKAEEEYRRSRGLMGVDYEGQVARPGIVSQQMQPAPVTDVPGVARPTVQRPATRAIKRSNLPRLRKQGLIAARSNPGGQY